MDLSYKDSKLKKILEDGRAIRKNYGSKQERKIIQRINELQAAVSLYDISMNPSANLHPLLGDRIGCFAVDVAQPFRIILKPQNGILSDLKTISSIKILEIVNYH